jgi:hypothetical protein
VAQHQSDKFTGFTIFFVKSDIMSFAGANDTPLGQSLEEVRAASTLPNITEKKEKYYLEIKKGWRDGLLFSKRIKGAGSEAQQDPTEQQIDEPPALQASETQQDAATRAQEASVERQIEVYCKWIVEVNKTNVSLGDLSLQDYVIEFFQYVTGFKKNVDFELALSIHASYEQLWEQTLQQFQTLETSSVAEEVDALRSLHDLQCLKQFVDMSEMATLLDMQNLQLLHEMLQSRNVGILNYLLEEHNLQQMQAQLQLQDQQQLQETLGYLAQLQRLKSIETLKLLQDTEMLRKLLMVQYLKTELSSKNLQALRSLLAWQDVKTLVVLLKLQVEQDVPNSMQEDAPPVPTTPVELPTTPIILQEGDQPKHSYIPGSKIEVDTYQIAVPNGDCSIHLLVQRWESGSVESNCPGPCGLIHRAILVDGGNAGIPSKYGIMASWIIRMTIDKIQQDYYQVTSALDKTPRRMGRFNRLKFDAWVVTHWDADHYMGALQVFCGEMAAFGQTQKCSYFRYDGDIPATILYCPSWSQGLDQKQPINLTITEGVPQTDGSFIAGMRVPDKYHTEKGKNELKFITRENVLRVRAGKELIWRDFWTDTALGNISTITDLKPLPQHEDWPLFVCVGANGDVFHGTKQSPYRKTEETPTNWSSIINLLYWPQQQYQNISMYWAGDAVDTVETRFAEAAIEAKFFGQKNVSIMKLSHHGSSGSTPNALLEVLKPKHFVVSAGGQYGHPSKPYHPQPRSAIATVS